jgi:glycosyltransferase involved in cell wall biosynthesis
MGPGASEARQRVRRKIQYRFQTGIARGTRWTSYARRTPSSPTSEYVTTATAFPRALQASAKVETELAGPPMSGGKMPVAKTTFMRDIVYLSRFSRANMGPAKPKLLLIVTSSAWGGAERYVVRMAAAAAAEFDVTVAAGASRSGELFRALPAGVKRFELADLVRPIAPLRDLKAVRRLRAFLDEERFDLVHANSSKAGLVAALAARLSKSRPRVLYTAHGWGFAERRSLPFRLAVLWSEKLAARWRAATVVLTEAERRLALAERLSPPERLHLVPLGIDADEIAFLERVEARTELSRLCGARFGRTLVGTIANAYPAKGLPFLLEAFERLAPELEDADLAVLGDGPDMPKLRALRAALPHEDRICLPGAVSGAARLLKAFDLFVLPSTKEGLPWAVLEASRAGVPVVATAVGALPELIDDGVTGRLVPPGDAAALADAIRSVLADRALYQRLKSGAPRIAERRSGSEMVAKTLALYRSLS